MRGRQGDEGDGALMADEEVPQTPFVAGQMAKPGAYRWWFFPVATEDGKTVNQLVIQGPGGDTHMILSNDGLIEFGKMCIEKGKAAKTTAQRLIVPDVQVPDDVLRNGGRPA